MTPVAVAVCDMSFFVLIVRLRAGLALSLAVLRETQTRWLNNRNLFRVWRLEGQDQGFGRVLSSSFFPCEVSVLGLQMASFFLWLPWFYVSVCICVQISSSYKDTSHMGLQPTLMILFTFITPLRPHLYTQPHLWSSGLGLQHRDFGGTIQLKHRH